MATENESGDPTTGQGETQGQQNQTTDNAGSGETPPGEQGQNQSQEPGQNEGQGDQQDGDQEQEPKDGQQEQGQKDPAKAALLADLHKERKDRQSAQSRVTELEAQVKELEPVKETLDAVQRKYDRLESFLTRAGGPLGKALDSRSFSQRLFETDDPIEDLVKDWFQQNPTQTSQALGARGDGATGGKVDINTLLRAAANK